MNRATNHPRYLYEYIIKLMNHATNHPSAYHKTCLDLQFLVQFAWMIFSDLFPNPVHD